MATLAGRAYVMLTPDSTSATVAIVDLAAGKVVGERATDLPTLLLADGPVW